mmetsp:Transcript_79307/g.206057  ORF Transcript_79307/g.206057 Transcript_79307/m.206057 type:complete len:224 (+) Transcript_79307:537-1208(+)
MRRTLPASKASLHLSPHLGPQLIVRRKLSSRSGARPKRAICNMFLRPTGRARSLRFNKSTRSSWRVSEVSPRLSPSLRLLLIARQRLSSKRGSKAKKVRCSMFLRPSGRTHSALFVRSTRSSWRASRVSPRLSPLLPPQLIARRKHSSRLGASSRRARCGMFQQPSSRKRSVQSNRSTRRIWLGSVLPRVRARRLPSTAPTPLVPALTLRAKVPRRMAVAVQE